VIIPIAVVASPATPTTIEIEATVEATAAIVAATAAEIIAMESPFLGCARCRAQKLAITNLEHLVLLPFVEAIELLVMHAPDEVDEADLNRAMLRGPFLIFIQESYGRKSFAIVVPDKPEHLLSAESAVAQVRHDHAAKATDERAVIPKADHRRRAMIVEVLPVPQEHARVKLAREIEFPVKVTPERHAQREFDAAELADE
jgi:hypothetical protein